MTIDSDEIDALNEAAEKDKAYRRGYTQALIDLSTSPSAIEAIAKQLYIDGFKRYGEDGEPTWSSSSKERDKNGEWTGRWIGKKGGDCGILNRKAAVEMWETGKHETTDGDESPCTLKMTNHDKKKWIDKAIDILQAAINKFKEEKKEG